MKDNWLLELKKKRAAERKAALAARRKKVKPTKRAERITDIVETYVRPLCGKYIRVSGQVVGTLQYRVATAGESVTLYVDAGDDTDIVQLDCLSENLVLMYVYDDHTRRIDTDTLSECEFSAEALGEQLLRWMYKDYEEDEEEEEEYEDPLPAKPRKKRK